MTGSHGGSAILAAPDLRAIECPILSSLTRVNVLECSAIEIPNLDGPRILVLSVYRAYGSDASEFMECLEDILTVAHCYDETAVIVLAGDFNVDLLPKQSKPKDDLLNLFYSFDLLPTVVDEPTRVFNQSRTCIDNIYQNYDKELRADVHHNYLSDHTGQYLNIDDLYRSEKRKSKKRDVYVRDFQCPTSKAGFIADIGLMVLPSIEVNESFEFLVRELHRLLEIHFPLRKKSINRGNQSKMINVSRVPEVMMSKENLKKLRQTASGSGQYRRLLSQACRRHSRLLRYFRRRAVEDELSKSGNKPRAIWSYINTARSKVSKVQAELMLDINGVKVCDPAHVASEFSSHFENAVKGFPRPLSSTSMSIPGTYSNKRSMFLSPVTEEELVQTASRVKASKAPQSRLSHPATIVLDGLDVLVEEKTCFLGLHLDGRLNYDVHVTGLCKQLSSYTFCLRKLKTMANRSVLLTAYHSLVMSRATYAMLFWGSAANLELVFRMQKRALRVLLGLKPGQSCRGKFRENKLMTVPATYVYRAVLFARKLLPWFEGMRFDHGYSTRRTDLMIVPRHRMKFFERCASFSIIKILNHIGDGALSCPIAKVKTTLKKYFIDEEFYSVKDFFQSSPPALAD
ncbi:hypothetical protein GE061_008310 [Apolygus lucorum]|uniref:Endonuclease/exonuclease/phosphatase domain-containing protein n=1 Tax=Apolygus lucorum TaxID=248454 RepID=A0A8S9WPA2_APOLU|nr:hypothetical protein GE061_008310 [Apolygus lucorum]